jgi:hypothetical protein
MTEDEGKKTGGWEGEKKSEFQLPNLFSIMP